MWERGLFSKRVTDRSGGLPTGPAVHVSDMIVSEKNQKSNRQNAQHSTGPKTPEGKAAIRFNALTYGLRTRATILERENAADYSQLWDELEAEWQPQNRTDAATWKPWSPHNGCSRGLPIARGGSTSSSNSAKNSSSCRAMFRNNARNWERSFRTAVQDLKQRRFSHHIILCLKAQKSIPVFCAPSLPTAR